MSKYEIYVNLSPQKAVQMIKEKIDKDAIFHKSNLLHEHYMTFPNKGLAVVLVYEKYYMRTENKGSLTVIVENSSGRTLVQSLASGTSQNAFLRFDWGAADDFAASIIKIFKAHNMQEE